MFRENLQNEQLIVLSYHMIDAFTLPFTLQAYIQQLETSRIRLSQLEQQVQVARVQVPVMVFCYTVLIFFMYMHVYAI